MISDFAKRTIRRLLPKAVHYRLANIYRRARRGRFRSRIIEREFRGHCLKLQIADSMAAGWYEDDWKVELSEFAVLERHRLCCGSRVFDIGAHQAVVALKLSKIVGPTGQVVAIEADPWNASIAEQNKQLNKADNLTVVLAVIGESDGRSTTHETKADHDRLFEWRLRNVPFRSVDSLAREFGLPDLVYCDVDGFEMSVIRGASATLQSSADWFVEIHVGCGLEKEGGSWEQVVEAFPESRFDRFIGTECPNSFIRFSSKSDLLANRFFLIAVNRDR